MRNYKRKSDRKPLTDAVLREARELINSGVSIRNAAKAIGYHEATLRQRLKKGKGVESLGRYKAVLSQAQENEIVQHCKDLDKRFYGLTLKSLRFLLYSYVQRNHIEHPFSPISQMAGRDYTRNFMKRNRLSLRVPRKTSIARTMGFNKIQLGRYFDNLENALRKYRFPPNRIYNVDETGIQTVPNKLPKHVAPIGKKDVAKAVAAEQGQTITAVCCMSATGHHIPPYFLFARKRMNLLLIKDGPTGCDMAVTDSGYMNTSSFIKYLEHFKKHTNPTEQNPVLLILDNHVSHTNLQAVTCAKDNFIHLLSLPPHSSHKTQPLDRVFFRPLKAYYESVADSWTTSNPGQVLSIYHVAGLFSTAFAKTATVDIAKEGFRATGIYPLNRNIFSDVDFMPSEVTEQDLDTDVDDEDRIFLQFEAEDMQEHSPDRFDQKVPQETESESTHHLTSDQSVSPIAGPSNVNVPPPMDYFSGTQCNAASPSDIIPLPKIKINRKRARKGLKSTLLTATPNKERLIKEQEEKDAAAREKERKQSLKKLKTGSSKVNAAKRKVFDESSSDDSLTLSFQESIDSDEMHFSEDEDQECNVMLNILPGDFVIVKVFGKKSYRLFVAKVCQSINDGYEGVFFKRMPNTFRFSETTENAFFRKDDIVLKLSNPIKSSSIRFINSVGFSNDLTEYSSLLD